MRVHSAGLWRYTPHTARAVGWCVRACVISWLACVRTSIDSLPGLVQFATNHHTALSCTRRRGGHLHMCVVRCCGVCAASLHARCGWSRSTQDFNSYPVRGPWVVSPHCHSRVCLVGVVSLLSPFNTQHRLTPRARGALQAFEVMAAVWGMCVAASWRHTLICFVGPFVSSTLTYRPSPCPPTHTHPAHTIHLVEPLTVLCQGPPAHTAVTQLAVDAMMHQHENICNS
jgi:hypothetical protein